MSRAIAAAAFGDSVYVSKWATFASSALIQACAGLSYSFSVYAPTVKDTLGLSQTQIATVGSAVNLGGYFAVLAGSMYDALEHHHALGPRLVIWLGSLCCFCGYLGLYLMVSGQVPGDYLQLLLFAACAGNAGTWFDTSTLVTNVRNFPNDRGCVVGILKSFLGLSASVYTSIYIAAFEPDTVSFLLMLAVAPPLLCLLLSAGVNYVPFVELAEIGHHHDIRWSSTKSRFLLSFVLVAVLSLYQAACALIVAREGPSHAVRWGFAAGMLLLLAVFGGIAHGSHWPWAQYGHEYLCEAEGAGGGGGDGGGADGAARGKAATRRSGGGAAAARSGGRGGPGAARPAGGRGGAVALPLSVKAGGGSGKLRHSPHGALSDGEDGADEPLLPRLRIAAPSVTNSSGSLHSLDRVAAGGAGSGVAAVAGGDLLPHHPMHQHHHRLKVVTASDAGEAAGGAGLAASAAVAVQLPSGDAACGGAAAPVANRSPSQMLRCLDFWLLFVQFGVGTGGCLAFLNNLGQLVIALGGQHDGQVVLVSLFSVANAAGRLLMGFVPEQQLHARGVPRTAFLAAIAATLAVACWGAAYAPLALLAPVAVLLGLCFGAHWSLIPAIISDLFGLEHFAANYAALQLAPAIGSLALATRLAGAMYDAVARQHGDPHLCVGPDCFRGAFVVLGALATASAVSSTLCAVRSAPLYMRIHLHLRDVAAAEEALTP